MVKIFDIRIYEFPKYKKIFDIVNSIYDTYAGSYYKVECDGIEHILHVLDSSCTLFTKEKDKYEVKIFMVDKDYNINSLIIGNKLFYYINGKLVSKDNSTGILESISLFKRKQRDSDGYNGFVEYVQYDEDSDKRLTQTFQHMYNDSERIYSFHLNKPYTISLEDNASLVDEGTMYSNSESYIRFDFDAYDDPANFEIATIKDFGVLNAMQKDCVLLQGKDFISRYYHIYGIDSSGRVITFYPLCGQYDERDMEEFIKNNGFNTKVSNLLLEIYNNDYYLLRVFQGIANSLKSLSPDFKTLSFEKEEKSYGNS